LGPRKFAKPDCELQLGHLAVGRGGAQFVLRAVDEPATPVTPLRTFGKPEPGRDALGPRARWDERIERGIEPIDARVFGRRLGRGGGLSGHAYWMRGKPQRGKRERREPGKAATVHAQHCTGSQRDMH
jgi:hypothetical protein